MKNIFESTSTSWVRYSEYQYKKSKTALYITPAPGAKLKIYDSFENIEQMILDALSVNMLGHKKSDNELKQSDMDFVGKYGLLGFMTALPTTPNFVEYDAVYIPKNEFIRSEVMPTYDYMNMFFPFKKPDFYKDEHTAQWNVTGDSELIALGFTLAENPLAMNIGFSRDYAERFDWLVQQFKSWTFTFTAVYLYYKDYDSIDEETRDVYRLGMSAFKGIAPTYHVALYEKPTIVWEFNSLLLGIQMHTH
jgi:hypothetical protein